MVGSIANAKSYFCNVLDLDSAIEKFPNGLKYKPIIFLLISLKMEFLQ